MSINEVCGRDPNDPQTFGKILQSNIAGLIIPVLNPNLQQVLTSGNTTGGLDINASGSSVIASHIKTSSLEGQTALETITITNPLKATNLATTASPLTKILYIDDATKDIKSGDPPAGLDQNIDFADFKYFIKNDIKSRYTTEVFVATEGEFQSAIFSATTYIKITLTTDIYLSGPLTITKPVYISSSGASKYAIRTSVFDGNLLVVQSDFVVFDSVSLLQRFGGSSISNCINVNLTDSGNMMNAFVDCLFETSEFAITGSWNNLFVLSTQFFSNETDSHRYIYPKKLSGLTIFDRCEFQGNTGNNTRIIQINSDTYPNSSWKGCKFVISNCSTYSTTSCQQVMETNSNTFPSGEGFEMYLINNNFSCSNGAVIFVQTSANLSGIRALYGYNNTITMSGGSLSKGLYAFSIGSGLEVPSSILYYMKGNTINGSLRVDYSDITIPQNKTIAVSYTPYNFPLVPIDEKDLHYIQNDLLICGYAKIDDVNITQASITEATIGDVVVKNNLSVEMDITCNGKTTTNKFFMPSPPTGNMFQISLNQPNNNDEYIYINQTKQMGLYDANISISRWELSPTGLTTRTILQSGNQYFANFQPNGFDPDDTAPGSYSSPLIEIGIGTFKHQQRISSVDSNRYVMDCLGNGGGGGQYELRVGNNQNNATRKAMEASFDGTFNVCNIDGATQFAVLDNRDIVVPSTNDIAQLYTGYSPLSYFYWKKDGTSGHSSDKRVKTNIRLLDDVKSYNFIKKLKPCVFNWKNSSSDVFGFIAQEVLDACETNAQKSLVNKGVEYLNYKATHNNEEPKDITLGLSLLSLIPEIVSSLQVAIKKIDELQTKIALLEKGVV